MKGNALMNRPVPSCTSILKILFQCTAVYCVLCTVYCVLCTDQTCSHVLVFNRILATSPFEPWTQVPPICSDFVHCIGMVWGTSSNLFDESLKSISPYSYPKRYNTRRKDWDLFPIPSQCNVQNHCKWVVPGSKAHM